MQIQTLQQSLNQIAQICNQLSQNEQANVSKLSQLQDAERMASQQLQHCIQLINQVSSQMQQIASSPQFMATGQMTGYQAGGTAQFGQTGQPLGSQYTNPVMSQAPGQSGHPVFNTYNDTGRIS